MICYGYTWIIALIILTVFFFVTLRCELIIIVWMCLLFKSTKRFHSWQAEIRHPTDGKEGGESFGTARPTSDLQLADLRDKCREHDGSTQCTTKGHHSGPSRGDKHHNRGRTALESWEAKPTSPGEEPPPHPWTDIWCDWTSTAE